MPELVRLLTSPRMMHPNTVFYPGTQRTAMNSLGPYRTVPRGQTQLIHATTLFQRALGRTQWNIFLSDELVQISCVHQTDSFHAARQKMFSRKRKNVCWAPSILRRAEHPDRTGTNKSCFMERNITVEGGRHLLRINTLLR